MADHGAVRELMIDVFEYPHMPYWFTIRQAIGIMMKTVIDAEKCMYPQVILVFDEKYSLMGTLSIRDILRGLAPRLRKTDAMADLNAYLDENALADLDSVLFSPESKKLLEKPIVEIMTPVNVFLSPEDSVVKAAYLMEHLNIQVLPVGESAKESASPWTLMEQLNIQVQPALEDKKSLVGIVRMIDVFQQVSHMILEK
jgi:CBS domain-containing protein